MPEYRRYSLTLTGFMQALGLMLVGLKVAGYMPESTWFWTTMPIWGLFVADKVVYGLIQIVKYLKARFLPRPSEPVDGEAIDLDAIIKQLSLIPEDEDIRVMYDGKVREGRMIGRDAKEVKGPFLPPLHSGMGISASFILKD